MQEKRILIFPRVVRMASKGHAREGQNMDCHIRGNKGDLPPEGQGILFPEGRITLSLFPGGSLA